MHDSIIIKGAREHNVMKSTLFIHLQLYEICRMICNKKRPPKGSVIICPVRAILPTMSEAREPLPTPKLKQLQPS